MSLQLSCIARKKIGVYDVSERLDEIDSAVILQNDLDQFTKAKQDTLAQLKRNIEIIGSSRTSCFPNDEQNVEDILRNRTKQVSQLYKLLEEKEDQFNSEILQKQIEMEERLMSWISQKIKEFRLKFGYEMLFDRSIIRYCDESNDITDQFISFINH